MKGKYLKMGALMTALLTLSSLAFAGNDASIKGDLRSNIHFAMNQYIQGQAIDGQMYVFDSADGKLLKLKLDELHDGIVKKGDFYVSCADFVDHNGRKVDIDFLVRKQGNLLVTTQAIVHAVNGDKRKYHLESI